MEYKFFKGDITKEPLKGIYDEWKALRKSRNKKLIEITKTIPFYVGWYGDETYASGIVCNQNSPLFDELQQDNAYKLTKVDNDSGNYIVRPNKRYKKGKEFAEKINAMCKAMNDSPDFSTFTTRELNLYVMVLEFRNGYVSVAGICDDVFIIKIPVKEEQNGGDNFPVIPDCLTEIKESEFLAIQGK